MPSSARPANIPNGWDPKQRLTLPALAVPLVALSAWSLLAWLSHEPPLTIVWLLLAVLALQWALALWVWRRTNIRSALFWVLCGFLFRTVGLFAVPVLEDDHFRFLWDGRSFAVSGNPYASAPAEYFAAEDIPAEFAEILDRINYPHVPTIYGPGTQLGFLAAYLSAPARLWPWKLILLASDAALIAALWFFAAEGSAGRRAALFAAWCPLSIFETAFNAHPEALAVSLMTLALVANARCRPHWTAAFCAAAAAARIPALLAAPFLLHNKGKSSWLVFAAVLTVAYLPFAVQGSWAELPGLRAFARDWEFNSSLYALAASALPRETARLACAAILALGALVLFLHRHHRPGRMPLVTTLGLLYAMLFLLSPVFNPWYALWILPFAALQPTCTGAVLLATVSLSYLTKQNLGEAVLHGFEHPAWVRPLEFGLVAAAVAVDFLRRPTIPLSQSPSSFP